MTLDLPAPVMLFDLDGTLTDSAPGILGGFRHALASVGAAEPSQQVLDGVVGPPMLVTLRGLGLDEPTAQRALAAYFDRYDAGGGWAENTVFDGIEPILAELTDRGIRLGVATSKAEHFAHRILDHFELSRYFDFIGGASADQRRSAKVDVIEHSLNGLGITPVADTTSGVVMVGDRDHDVDGAAQWGIPTIFAGWGYGLPHESAQAHWVAGSVTELAALLHARE